jgi:acetyl-CoA C-acetyltransferase
VTYIIDAIRTPICKQNGAFKHIIPEELASKIFTEILQKNNVPHSQVSNIFMANAFGTGGNMARNASLRAFSDNSIACTTIDAQCSGGLRAIEIGNKFCMNDSYVLAGGMESCSLAPEKFYHKLDPRFSLSAYSQAEFSPENSENSLFDAAKNVALKYDISKAEMLEWTFDMHQRACSAINSAKKYILDFEEISIDQSLRPDLSLDEWQKLQTEKLIDRTTAARPADAAAVLLLSKNSKNAISKIICSVSIGSGPGFAPEGVIDVTEKLIEKAGIDLSEITAFEISDSFAVNALSFAKKIKIEKSKINKSGGILAYGHAYGATGAINVIHLLASLRKGEKGLLAVPGAGGQASGMIIEKL